MTPEIEEQAREEELQKRRNLHNAEKAIARAGLIMDLHYVDYHEGYAQMFPERNDEKDEALCNRISELVAPHGCSAEIVHVEAENYDGEISIVQVVRFYPVISYSSSGRI